MQGDLYELLTRIHSMERIEVVVALHSAPRATMSVDELCTILKYPRESVRQTVMELRAIMLVVLTLRGEVQLLPPTSRDQAAVAELVQMYNQDRTSLTKLLGEIAVDRVRAAASRAFADAFILRKKSPRDGEDD